MKFILVFILFICRNIVCNAQDGYYLTREQHEQIRKNLEDYKIFRKKYVFHLEEFERLKAEFEFLKKLHSAQTIELENLKLKSIELHNHDVLIKNLNLQLAEQRAENLRLHREIDYKNKSLNILKGKYDRELKLSKGERITTNIIWSTMVSLALVAIYHSIEVNYL